MEMTVLQAKNHLSELLRRAESGEEVLIRRGRRGKVFRIAPVPSSPKRSLAVNPKWKKGIHYQDADIWASEWEEEG